MNKRPIVITIGTALLLIAFFGVFAKAYSHNSCAANDPSWAHLKTFLAQDKGNEKRYDSENFNCENFSFELRDHARDQGIRSAYVGLDYAGPGHGHAIVAFDVLEYGKVYIEPQSDSVAYVLKGKPFGTITLEAVKRKFLSCPKGGPERFADPLETEVFEGNIFSYPYYEKYRLRVKCYRAAAEALNAAVDAYNHLTRKLDDEIVAFNNGRSKLSIKQIRQKTKELENESAKIDQWSANLKLFSSDLGQELHTEDGVVTKIKAIWN